LENKDFAQINQKEGFKIVSFKNGNSIFDGSKLKKEKD